MGKKATPWSKWLNRLTPQAKSLLSKNREETPIKTLPKTTDPKPETEARSEFQRFLGKLPAAAASALLAHEFVEGDQAVDEMEGSFYLIEFPEGEKPILRKFTDTINLATRMQQLEGEDMFVIPFYGSVMSFSKLPSRYLMVADGVAILIPSHGPVSEVEVYHDEVVIEDTFYLGDPRNLETAFDLTPHIEKDDDEEEFDDAEDELADEDDDDDGEFAS